MAPIRLLAFAAAFCTVSLLLPTGFDGLLEAHKAQADEITKKEAKKLLGKPLSAKVDKTGEPLELDDDLLGLVETVWTDPGETPRFEVVAGKKRYALPLKHTHVDAKIRGTVVQVEVTQSYTNPFDHPIETLYVFPLPENSAVNAMQMVIGDRVIEADIKKRQEARKLYDDAKAAGHTASLLEQERPNVFTQSVANVGAGESLDVVIGYVQDLTYDAGTYEFVFPMVVGPRYIPGDKVSATKKGHGWSLDTTEVGDASRVTPPIVGAGERAGQDISLELEADAELAIHNIRVLTHEVVVETESDGSFKLALAELDSLPNRDFVLRYDVAETAPVATLANYKDDKDGYFTLMVHPPELDLDALVGARELIFVVDVSGSMNGKPLAMCKDAMSQALAQVRPVDTFNVITFAGSEAMLWNEARPANQTNINEALGFVDQLSAGGGTEMKNAIDAALDSSGESRRNRYVFFMTDGLVGNEEALLQRTAAYVADFEKLERKARVFGFGVGSAPNRYLMEGLAEAGKGATVFASNREDPTLAVNRFFGLIDHVIVEDVQLRWEGVEVSEVYPTDLPSFFASKPLVVHGRMASSGEGQVVLTGKAANQPFELRLSVDFPDGPQGDPVHGTLWARAKIKELERDQWSGYDTGVVEAITEVALAHRIVTPYTSFVAVDRSRVVKGTSKTVVQGVDAAEEVDIFGLEAAVETLPPVQLGDSSGVSGEGFGVGSFGTSGRGGGGGGSGAGVSGSGVSGHGVSGSGRTYGSSSSSLGDKSVSKPMLKLGRPQVSGSLDKRVIRKVIGQHKSEVKACYEKQLMVDGTLAGRLEVKFSISEDGVVISVVIVSNTLSAEPGEAVGACVAKAMESWNFPAAQGGGLVVVTYPFNFEVGKE